MATELTPRDIQTRVRAGESVDDLVAAAGAPESVIRRFADPVLAERAHMASRAASGTLRRSTAGDVTPQRPLSVAIDDRLRLVKVVPTDVAWDSYRMADGRWAVTATYAVQGEPRTAEFLFQPQGRFSVTANDEARGLVGEKAWEAAGESDWDNEPTVDLADEIAIVRVIQDEESETPPPARTKAKPATKSNRPSHSSPAAEPAPDNNHGTAPTKSRRRQKRGTPANSPAVPAAQPAAAQPAAAQPSAAQPTAAQPSTALPTTPAAPASPVPPANLAATPPPRVRDHLAKTGVDDIAVSGISEDATSSELDRLFAMFDGPATGESDSTRIEVQENYRGLSDAAAVPDVSTANLGEPQNFSDDLLEPSLFDDDPDFAPPPEPKPRTKRRRGVAQALPPDPIEVIETAPDTPAAETANSEVTVPAEPARDTEPAHDESLTAPADEAPAETARSIDESGTPHDEAGTADDDTGTSAEVARTTDDAPASTPRKKKGRASVPSWDEIMFGSPRRR